MRKMKQNIWSKTFCKRVRGGKYDPHQGEQEKARRIRQIEKGMIKI